MKIVDSIKEANTLTRTGKFHAADVMSAVILDQIFQSKGEELLLYRSSEDIPTDFAGIIFHAGDIHNVPFQNITSKQRRNGISFSSFGLLWQEFGKTLLSSKSNSDKSIDFSFFMIDEEFVMMIDAIEIGRAKPLNLNFPNPYRAIGDYLLAFNLTWTEDALPEKNKIHTENLYFSNAVHTGNKILNSVIDYSFSDLDPISIRHEFTTPSRDLIKEMVYESIAQEDICLEVIRLVEGDAIMINSVVALTPLQHKAIIFHDGVENSIRQHKAYKALDIVLNTTIIDTIEDQ